MSSKGIVGVPRVPSGMAVRQALLTRLGRAPLTVIRAPGGSGKTVLMAQWAAQHQGAGGWITVEPDIGSRLSFWSAAVDSLSHLGLHPPTEDGADRDALRAALVRTFRTVHEPVVLVIDDAHALQDSLVVEDLLALLRACKNVTAVVSTRVRTELEAPREALTLDVAVIGPEELILTAAEVESIVGEAGSRFGSPVELLEASGGSPLLLRAILAQPSGSVNAGGAVVADYLRGLFQKQDGLEAFVSTTAIPDDIDIDTAHRFSGLSPERVGVLLDKLEAGGLVMRRDVSTVPRYRYHPLVREAVREASLRQDPARFRHVSLLASADAEARKQFIPALRHAVAAEDYARASDVCLHGGFALLRSRGAAAILQQVPVRHIARQPFLSVVLGLAANARGERLRALEFLTLALGASRALRRSQRVAERAGLALIETVVLRITGRAGDSVGAARRMLALLEEAAPADLEEIADQLGSYRYQGALSLFRAGRLSEARVAGEWVGVSPHSLQNGSPDSLGAASLVATVHAARGENRAAATTLAQIDESSFSGELRDGYVGSLSHLARGILALESGDADAAARAAEFIMGRANLEHGMLFVALRAFVELWQGAPETGLRAIDERESIDRPRARLSAEDRQVVAAARVLLHAALGQIAPAYSALRGLDRNDPVAAVLHATLLTIEQRPESAIERLNGQAEWHGPRLRAAGELLMADASLLRGDEVVARAAFRRFVATTEIHGILSPVLLIPVDHRARLWEFAASAGVGEEVLDRLSAVPAPLRTGRARVALTPREVDVLEQLRDTASFAEIAATLSVSANTVKSQVRTMYRKLGVSSRDEALRTAYLQGLLGD